MNTCLYTKTMNLEDTKHMALGIVITSSVFQYNNYKINHNNHKYS